MRTAIISIGTWSVRDVHYCAKTIKTDGDGEFTFIYYIREL